MDINDYLDFPLPLLSSAKAEIKIRRHMPADSWVESMGSQEETGISERSRERWPAFERLIQKRW